MALKIEMKTLLLAFLSGLWAFIPILTSYSANLGEIGLDFVLLFGLLCAVGTVCIFAVMNLIFRSPFAAFGSCVVGWFCVSASYSVIFGVSDTFGMKTTIPTLAYGLLMLILFFGVGYGIKRLVARYQPNEKFVLSMVSVVVAVLLVVSAVPVVLYSVQMNGFESVSDSDNLVFSVEEGLPKPNIYWIHAESMVNEKTFEKYWGEETVGLTEELESRGFFVNQDADTHATPSTTLILAAFMSPRYYDVNEEYYLKDYAGGQWSDEVKNSTFDSRSRNIYKYENELTNAFSQAGYNTIGINKKTDLYYTGSEFAHIYLYSDNFDASLISDPEADAFQSLTKLDNQYKFITYTTYPIFLLDSIIHIWDIYWDVSLATLSPVDVSMEYVSKSLSVDSLSGSDWIQIEYGSLLNSVADAVNTTSNPKLVCLYPSFVHVPYQYDEQGNNLGDVNNSLSGYYGQYLFSEKVLLYMVSMIQESDPHAVIIIQGDHGPHSWPITTFTDEFGSDADLVELRHHVLSAIYIPEEYQTEDYEEILSNPLNIARYLVNNFVGENYEYK